MIEGIVLTLLAFGFVALVVVWNVKVLTTKFTKPSEPDPIILDGRPKNLVHDVSNIVYTLLSDAIGEDLAELNGSRKLRSFTVPLEIRNGVEEIEAEFGIVIPSKVYSKAETVEELINSLVDYLIKLIES